MSDQQAQEVSNDAPLLNPQTEEAQPEGFQEQPIPLHDAVSDDEPALTTDMEEDAPLDRPDYYPEKFWDDDGPDVEKLAKSYAELEKAFRAGKHKAPDGDYDVSGLEDRGFDMDDPLSSSYHEWAKKYGISQQAFSELAETFLEINGDQFEEMEADRRIEMQKLGERAQEKISMAERLLSKAPLNNAEREAMAYSLNSADAINAFLKYHQSLTNEGIPIKPMVAQPEMSRVDLEAAIADPRWTSDPAWRSKIEKQWFESNN